MKAIIFFVMVILSAQGLRAAESLTLSSAIETARGHDPNLRKAELSSHSAGWGRLEALAEHLPHLDVRGTHFLGAKYSTLNVVFGGNAIEFPTAYPQTEVTLEASMLLFDGLASFNRYRAARLESEAADLELSHARLALEEGVTVRFHQAVAARELAKVTDQNIETLEQHLKLARANERAGFSTNVDVLRIEAQLEEARAERMLAQDNVTTARSTLDETMGVEKDDRGLEGSLPVPNSKRVPTNLSFDVSRREDLQAQLRHEQAQDRMSAAAGGFWFPRVSLFGNQQFYKFGNFDPAILPTDHFKDAHSFGIRLTWNLFDGGASLARQQRADDRAAIAAQDSRKQLIGSPHDFETWKRRYIYNVALFEARQRAVAKSTESVRLATIAARAGTKTHSEVLDAELELFRARAGVIHAQLEASEALAHLELALGHRL